MKCPFCGKRGLRRDETKRVVCPNEPAHDAERARVARAFEVNAPRFMRAWKVRATKRMRAILDRLDEMDAVDMSNVIILPLKERVYLPEINRGAS